MPQMNSRNERLKMDWIKELEITLSDKTIDQKLAAMARWDEATAYADYTGFDRAKVDRFIASIKARKISSATKVATVRHVKSCFEWMIMDERLKPKAARKPLSALRLPLKDTRAGLARNRRRVPKDGQIKQALTAMPFKTAIERRNRALIAFTYLSGARDGAIISMRVGDVDLDGKELLQHPDRVDTKASKQIYTWFFPVGDDVEAIVADYISYLRTELGFTDDAPLFPTTAIGKDENDHFIASGLSKAHWANAQPMRDIFRHGFASAGLPYFNPHSFRKTLMKLAYDKELPPAKMKAWSQNLGHENLDTSVNSYGQLSPDQQRREMMELRMTSTERSKKDAPMTQGQFEELKALITAKTG